MLVYSFDGSAIARKYAEPVFESTTFPFCLFTGGGAAHKHVLELVERLREELNSPDSEHRIFYDPQSEEEHCCDDDCGHHHH